MSETAKRCIVTVAFGSKIYLDRQRKLAATFKQRKPPEFKCDLIIFQNLPPGAPSYKTHRCAFKSFAFEEARRRGFNVVMYCDATIWFTRSPESLFDAIESDGYLFIYSNAYLAGKVDPRVAGRFKGIDLTEVRLVKGGFYGLDFRKPVGRELLTNIRNYSRDDTCCTAKPYRSDEAPLSVLVHTMGLKAHGSGKFFDTWDGPYHDAEEVVVNHCGV
jgi:hypothetical protein